MDTAATATSFASTRSVIDGEFFFVGSGIQFAGLTSRHPGGGSGSNLLMCKIQNNGGVADFDRVFQYEQSGASNYLDMPGGTQSAYCRMVTLNNEFWMETDADKDGVYELVMAPKPITLALGGTLVGMDAYQTSEMDNFEFFDAVLLPQVNAVPHVGQNYDMRLYTPSPLKPWIGGLTLGGTRPPPRALRIELQLQRPRLRPRSPSRTFRALRRPPARDSVDSEAPACPVVGKQRSAADRVTWRRSSTPAHSCS